MVIIHKSLSLLDGLSPLNFLCSGKSPVPQSFNIYTQGSQAWLDTKRDVENWDKSDEAGYQTILLHISPNYRFIVQQNQGVTALQLWTPIMLHNRNNTKGHRGLARQRWQSCKQSSKQSLDEYISAYGHSHTQIHGGKVHLDHQILMIFYLSCRVTDHDIFSFRR